MMKEMVNDLAEMASELCNISFSERRSSIVSILKKVIPSFFI